MHIYPSRSVEGPALDIFRGTLRTEFLKNDRCQVDA